ncbi:MAG: hypothetical protein ACREMN_01080 [Gemmatimonadales bacterium]
MQTPQVGQIVVWNRGRRFVTTPLEGVCGGWFNARSEDGRTVLRSNARLVWDPRAGVWRRPAGAQNAGARAVRAPSRHSSAPPLTAPGY